MYPMFTGSDPSRAATIDLVTGSDLPYNHLPYLGPSHYDPKANPPWSAPPNWRPKTWSVVGTVNEATDIVVGAPSAASVSSVADLVSAPASFSRTLVGLDENTCPACVKNGELLARALGGAWTYTGYNSTAFVDAVKGKLAAGESEFAVVWFVPTYLNGLLKTLKALDGTAPWPPTTANQGKVIVRNDRTGKLTEQARNFLGAVYIGNKHIVQMDSWAQESTPKEAADKWIGQNPHIFDMFLGQFNTTATAPARLPILSSNGSNDWDQTTYVAIIAVLAATVFVLCAFIAVQHLRKKAVTIGEKNSIYERM